MSNDRIYKLDCFCYKHRLNAAEWAEQNRYMQNTHGMFSFAQTPFLREPTQYLSDIAGTCRIVLKTPAQVGKTTMIENFLGWICEYDRSNTLLILDSLKTGQRMSKNRLRPFLKECGIGEKGDDSVFAKSNEVCNIGLQSGASLIIGSASSASDLCSTPAKYLCADELDRWIDVLSGEGDPLMLAFQRQMRFRGMSLLTSTPTTSEGRITKHFMIGTQQSWVAVCECGAILPCHYDAIDFASDIPCITCDKCGQTMSQSDVSKLAHVFTSPLNETPYKDKYGRVARSYEVEGTLCHAFYTWDQLRREELAATAIGIEAVRSFVNTRLGVVYIPKDDIAFSPNELLKLCLSFSIQSIPKDIDTITCGIDTQDNGLALEFVGWNAAGIAYGLGYYFIDGDTETSDPWIALRQYLKRKYKSENGKELSVSLACIDSGGHRTREVYAFCAATRNIFAIKGYARSSQQDPLVRGYSMQKLTSVGRGTGRIALYSLGVNTGKDILIHNIAETLIGNVRLKWTSDPDAGYTDSYFDQITAERRVEAKNGTKWELIPGRRNEALDCRVYAMAAREILRGRKCEIPSVLKDDEVEKEKESVEKKKTSEKIIKEKETKQDYKPKKPVKRSL